MFLDFVTSDTMSSSSYRKCRGALIIDSHNLTLSILDSGHDEEGRIVFVKTVFGNTTLAFVSVYAPNVYDQDFFLTPSLSHC